MSAVEVHTDENRWSSSDGVLVRGELFSDGTYRETDGAALFDDVYGHASFVERLSTLTGQYAVIVDRGETVHAAVDHIRSVPLYYGTNGDTVYLSDSPSWIRGKLSSDACDPDAVTEFLLTGYVTGNETLYPALRQLQPGQVLTVRGDDTDPRIGRHFSFTGAETARADRATLLDRLQSALDASFERLARRADGRPLLLGLSGGYDSRLIALMLDRIGYENVYTFTFPDFLTDGDREIASQVAGDLSFEWEPIDITERDLWEFFHADEYERLRASVEDYATVTPFLFWALVLSKVRDAPALPDEGIVLTGHGIGGAGAHQPDFDAAVDRQTAVDWVWTRHYNMRHIDDADVEARMKRRIRDRVGPVDDGDPTAVLDAIIGWYWQERTPKFLARHADSYAFWGYDRWLPLWDRELAAFWATVPMEYRREKALYRECIEGLSEGTLDLSQQSAGTADVGGIDLGTALSLVDTAVSRLPMEETVRNAFRRWQAHSVRNSEQSHRYGFLTDEQFEALHPRTRHPKYFHALDKLSTIGCEPPRESPLYEDLQLYEASA